MSGFKFSIIKILDDDILAIDQFISSIIKQKLNFEKNIELILIDLGNAYQFNEIVSNYQLKFPENIKLYNSDDKFDAYNTALKKSSGDYIHFCKNQTFSNKNKLLEVFNNISKNGDDADIFTLEDHIIKNKFDLITKIDYVQDEIVDLNKYPNHSLFDLNSVFIKKNSINGIKFDKDLGNYAETRFICEILLKKEKLGLVKNDYFISNHEDSYNHNISRKCIQNSFSLINYLMKYSQKEYIQYIIAKILSKIIYIEDLNELYSNDEVNAFWDNFNNALNCLDVNNLKTHNELLGIEKSFLIYLIYNEFHIKIKKPVNKVFLKSNEYRINSLHFHLLRIDIVEIVDNCLNLSGSFTSNCYPENITIKAVRKYENGTSEEFIGKYVEYPTTDRKIKKFLGIKWEFNYNFDIKIPLKDNEKSIFNFKVIYHDENDTIEMENSIIFREFAGLSKQGNYLVKDNRIILFRGKTFYILPYSYLKILKLELKTIVRILRMGGPFLLQAIFYRVIYVILYPFWKNKKIWVFVDREDAADDNAEHLFKYSHHQEDGIKKYFAINKDCEDYKRLNNKYNDVIPFGSFKHKLNYLFSEKIIISQVTRRRLNPFTHENSYLYEGLNTYKFCFLQHGVTKDDISWWIKKYHKNLYLFLTVSEKERESIVNGHYNYDESRIPVLGFPRYDNLVSNPKKEILFIPTWRRDLNNYKDLINSQYVRDINSFLTNEKLIQKINELNYKLVFKPHPELFKFKDLFNLDNVELADGSFQEMFSRASLMITDFSSVAFDFAYLRKPVIYYQKNDDYHYSKGYYDYQTMGFGQVIDNEDELVEKIIDYMENDCLMDEEYIKRVESFFKFHDKNNCKRVYEWLYSH